MNRKNLQKVLDALKEKKPNISYIQGIIETLLDGLPEENNKEQQKDAMNLIYKKVVENSMDQAYGLVEQTPEQQAVQDALNMTSVKPKTNNLIIEKNINLN